MSYALYCPELFGDTAVLFPSQAKARAWLSKAYDPDIQALVKVISLSDPKYLEWLPQVED